MNKKKLIRNWHHKKIVGLSICILLLARFSILALLTDGNFNGINYSQINWSGYAWNVVNDSWSGNNFSDSADNVFVDVRGNLHLKIVNRNGTWYSSEVIMADPVGYGAYTTVIASDISVLDKNVDAGSFYYNNANADEIDIEFSRWESFTMLPNVEYGIHHYISGIDNDPYVHINLSFTTNLTNIFNWQSNGKISFATKDSSCNSTASLIYPTHQLTTGGNYELELFLLDGKPPSNGLEQEIVLSNFTYISSGR